MIKRKRKRNPTKDDKKLMRKVAELLAKTIEKEPDGITAYLLATELVQRDSLYCEECQSYDIEKGCDWDICYPEIYDLVEESTLDMAKEAAEELAEDLGIVDYVNLFRFDLKINKKGSIKPELNFKDKNLTHLDLSELNLYNINLSGSDLSGSDLSGSDLFFAYLTEVNLNNAVLIETNLKNTLVYDGNLSKADLSKADLSKADLAGANLSEANLSEATLSEAILTDANLTDANLTDANLSGTHFTRTNLLNTNFTNSKINNYTDFNNVINADKAIEIPPKAWNLFKTSNPKKFSKKKKFKKI